MQKADGLLNLLINVPESIRNEIIYGYGIGDVEETNIELIILYSGTLAIELHV